MVIICILVLWQIWLQFPCSFEYNEDFLVMLFKHTYASQFGEFLNFFVCFKFCYVLLDSGGDLDQDHKIV